MKNTFISKMGFQKLGVVLFVLYAFGFNASADVTITAPSLTVYSCTTFPTPYYTLGDIVITETAKDEITQCGCVQTLILTAPTNFEFNPNVGTVTESPADDVTAVTLDVTATTITVTITTNAGGTSLTDVVTISGIGVRGINGVTGASTVTRTGGTQVIVGDVNGTVHATLDSQNGGPAPTTSAA
ncbi:MAG: hypothetical protein JKX74_05530 [Flavobacteriales bacterium]|nr:hypothetical protein [Flavobacteriales bacterium]